MKPSCDDEAQRDESVHHPRRRPRGRRHHDVDVAHRLRESPERSAVRDVNDTGHFEEPRFEAARERKGNGDGRPSEGSLLLQPRERLGNLLLRFRAEALQRADLFLADRGSEIIDRLDTELRAETIHRLRSEPLDAQERYDARRVLLAQSLELGDSAELDELSDLFGCAFADALDLLKLLRAELAEINGLPRERMNRALVGANAKRLRVALVEDRQLSQLPKHLEDVFFDIAHGHL